MTTWLGKNDDIVNKYNNKHRSTIKMKPIDVKSNIYINSGKKLIIKRLRFKFLWRSFGE